MIAILQKMGDRIRIINSSNREVSLYQAADLTNFDVSAYVQLTDEFIRTSMKGMKDIYNEYAFSILQRNLMRNAADMVIDEPNWPSAAEKKDLLRNITRRTIGDETICGKFPTDEEVTIGSKVM